MDDYPSTTLEIDVLAIADDVEGFESAAFTQWLEKTTGIVINWDPMKSSDAAEKVSIIAASGDLPDVFVTRGLLSANDVYDYAQRDIVRPLNALIEECAPDMRAALDGEEGKEFRDRLTMPDQEIYSFPYIHYCFPCQYPLKMWIYGPWLVSLGIEMPGSTETFRDYLSSVKSRDTSDDGGSDVIPLIGVWGRGPTNPMGFLMNSFTFTKMSGDGSFLVQEQGVVHFVADTAEWREGLKYMNALYEERLLEFQTIDDARELVGKTDTSLVGAFAAFSYWDVATQEREGDDSQSDRSANYQAIAPLDRSGVRQTPYYAPMMLFTSHITAGGKDKERRITQLMNWWFIEPKKNNYLCEAFWREGVDWRDSTEEERKSWDLGDGYTVETVLMREPRDIVYDNGWAWSCFARWETRAYEAMPSYVAADPVTWERLIRATKVMVPFAANKSVPPDVVFSEEGRDSAVTEGVTSIVMEFSFRFIIGDLDIENDADWKNYKDQLIEHGVERYVGMWRNALD